MKKIFLLIGLLCQIPLVKAQDIADAVRYSSSQLDGTARFVSMGGAFGALGGDLSSLKINPAGSAVFLTNQAAFSLGLNAYKNETDYTDGNNSYRNNYFDLNQAGIVFVFDNQNTQAAVSKLTFGITYDRTNSYKNRFNAVGSSNESIHTMFMNFAQGVPLDLFTTQNGETLSDLYSYLGSADFSSQGFNNNRLQTAYLGYEAYIFDAVDPSDMNNTTYISNVTGSTFNHVYHNYTEGSNGKLTFNGGLEIQKWLYLGANLNLHFIDYHRTTILNEYIPNSNTINEINFVNDLDTKGNGFSFQVGGIARLNSIFRVGVSYQSPTWYKISDETSQLLRTNHATLGDAIANPQVTNVFPDYNLRTPGKISGSLAAVFGKSGLLSFDYSYKNYANTKFTSPGFDFVNNNIGNLLQGVSTYSLGGEYRINRVSLRGGFRYQDSPYKDHRIGDLHNYSAGIGYDFGGVKLDFAYALAHRNYNTQLLHTGFTNQAHIKNDLSSYVLTLSYAL